MILVISQARQWERHSYILNEPKAKSLLLTSYMHVSSYKLRPHNEQFCTAFGWLQDSDFELREEILHLDPGAFDNV